MATFLVVHGAWTGGWFWRKMRPLLRAMGHELLVPTMTGVGERAHLSSRDVGLDTHVTDLLNVLEFEDLHEVILAGHSYGGMVATAVADRAADRISKLLYIDAFVPRDGQCLLDLVSPEGRARTLENARTAGDGWLVPPNPMPPDTSEADLAWTVPRRLKQPLKTFEQPVRLTGAVDRLPKAYVYCTRPAVGDYFRQFAEHARREPGWSCVDLDASHNPHITAPEPFAVLLHELSR